MIAEQQQQPLQKAKAVFGNKVNLADRKSPTVTTGDNIYVVCWNGTEGKSHTNVNLFFRSSTDNGATFSDKINLSITTDADSIDAEITADGDDVVVTWWERNITSIDPVMKVSTDNGETFAFITYYRSPLLMTIL